MPNFDGSLSGESRSATYTLPGGAVQAVGWAISTSHTMGSLPGTVGLGTTMTIEFCTADLSVALFTWTFNSYENPTFITLATPESNQPPDGGSSSFTYTGGVAHPGGIVSAKDTGIMIVNALEGGGALAKIQNSNPDCNWNSVGVNPTTTTLNQFGGIIVSESEGIDCDFEITLQTNQVESLILNAVTAIAGSKLSLGGFNIGNLAQNLSFYQDGLYYGPVTNFIPGEVWTGTGGYASPGTHVIYVEDTQSTVQSNVVTYSCPLASQRAMLLE